MTIIKLAEIACSQKMLDAPENSSHVYTFYSKASHIITFYGQFSFEVIALCLFRLQLRVSQMRWEMISTI